MTKIQVIRTKTEQISQFLVLGTFTSLWDAEIQGSSLANFCCKYLYFSFWRIFFCHSTRRLENIVEKTQLRSAKRWQCITRLINKSETTVMVSYLIPHRSSNILLCSYFCPSSVNSSTCLYTCPSSVDSFTVFSFPSVFCRFLV